jgi:hypothetical protein
MNFPMSGLSEEWNIGPGAGLSIKYYVLPKLAIGGAAAINYFHNSVSGLDPYLKIIPVELEGTFFFTNKKISPYASFGAGLFLLSLSCTNHSWSPNNTTVSETDLGIIPRLGTLLKLGKRFFIDFNVTYHLIFTNPGSLSNLLDPTDEGYFFFFPVSEMTGFFGLQAGLGFCINKK